MPLLHRLRRATFLVRLVLASFVLSMGVAVASPVVNPRAMELVCTSTGAMKLLVQTDDGMQDVTEQASGHSLDCPLCVSVNVPPLAGRATAALPSSLAYALQSIPAARLAWLTAAPLPARGPPASL